MSRNIGLDIPFYGATGVNYLAGTVVCTGSIGTNNRPVPIVATTVSLIPLGVIVENTDNTLRQNPTVRMGGSIDAIAGAAIDPSVEPRLTFDTSGRVIPMPASTGDYPIVGYALEKVTTLGDLVEILVAPSMQHHA